MLNSENDDDETAGQGEQNAVDPRLNIAIGWTSLALGAVTGMLMGLWAFSGPLPVPGWIGEYGDLPRRLMRLGHIAFFGLGILNILLSSYIVNARLRATLKHAALWLMNIGNVFLPLTLIAASVFLPFKYLMAIPATAVSVALVIGAKGAFHNLQDK